MSPDLIDALNPPRLPAAVVATGWADVLAAFGLGLLLAAALLTLAGPLLRPRPARRGLEPELAATRALPPQERLLALSRLLADAKGSLPPDLRSALYTGQPCDAGAVEALVRAAWAAHPPGRRDA